jgi:hypothetical protein
VRIRLFSTALLLVASSFWLSAAGLAQTTAKNSASGDVNLLASLPQSDAVAQVKVKRLLGDVMPKLLESNPTKLAELNSDIERFKNRTGLDPRLFDNVALGLRYSYPSPGVTKITTVALANGTFNANALVAAGRIAADGTYREDKYSGKTIYIFNLDERIKVFGVFGFRIGELAACPLDGTTLAVGDPVNIRSVIDAYQGKRRSNAELILLATREPNAIVGFGGNFSPEVLKNLDIGNASIANDLSGVRQVYGNVGTSETDVQLFIAARTINADAARNLGDTLEGLKQLGALFIGRLSGARGMLARSALGNLKVVTQANELQIRTSVAQAEIAPLMGN